jgi:hypothetical protein
MKRINFLALVFFVFPLLVSERLQALELRFFGGVENFAFDPGLEASLGAAAQRFEPRIVPFGLVGVEGDLAGLGDFSLACERDPLLGNRIRSNIGIRFDFVKLDFGPFISAFNSSKQIINPGIAAALALEFPGLVFGSLKAASTIGSLAALPGEHLQQTGEIALGFWVPYVVCTLSINSKAFTERKTDKLTVKTERIRYQFRADMFTKNVPYTVYIDLGYQTLKRSYVDSGSSSGDELKSIYTGFEITYRIAAPLRLILGAELPVYTWAAKPFKGPAKDTFLYEFRGGIIWTLPEKPTSPP